MSITFGAVPLYADVADSRWEAWHAGYSELARDATYVAGGDEWTGLHAPYEDVYVASEPAEPSLPDRRAMWAAVHPPDPAARSLDDAVVTEGVSSGGTLSLTLQRDSSPRDQALPMSTTLVQVTVLGTDVTAWQVFPDVSPTLDVNLAGMPAGIHTVEVKAWSNGRVVGTTVLTVTVESPSPAPAPAQEAPRASEPPSGPSLPRLEDPTGPPPGPREGSPVSLPEPVGAGRVLPVPVVIPLGVVEVAPLEPEPEGRGPARRVSEDRPVQDPAGEAWLAGQAMASGMGLGGRSPVAGGAEGDEVSSGSVTGAGSTESSLDGRGDGRRQPGGEGGSR